MKLKLIALAAMLAATGAANAAIDMGTEGDGSLILNLESGSGGSGISATFDLGVSLSTVATWSSSIATSVGSGVTWFRSWDLNTGNLSGTGLNTSNVGSYGTAFSQFTTAAGAGTTGIDMANAEMNVFAFDSTGTNPGDRRLFTTAGASINGTGTSATTPTVSNGTFNGIFGGTNIGNFLTGVNVTAGHSAAANGANFAVPGTAANFNSWAGLDKLGQSSMFDTTGKFSGQYAAGTGVLSGEDKALPFYLVNSSSNSGIGASTRTVLGYDIDLDGAIEFDNNGALAGGLVEQGLWTLQGNTLTFQVTAVPEAETYAMMLAGLGLMGAVVRRRRKSS